MNKTVRNERRKLLATALNNIAVALIVGGVIGPLILVAAGGHYFGGEHPPLC